MRFKRRYPNFTLAELIASPTAVALGIDNTPDFEQVEHLEELVSEILQPLRTYLRYPLYVTSGYRCEALNKEVGGVKTSAHLYGYAADIQVADMRDFAPFVIAAENWLRDKDIAFDQSIIERSRYAWWWHIAVRNGRGEQRRQFLSIQK